MSDADLLWTYDYSTSVVSVSELCFTAFVLEQILPCGFRVAYLKFHYGFVHFRSRTMPVLDMSARESTVPSCIIMSNGFFCMGRLVQPIEACQSISPICNPSALDVVIASQRASSSRFGGAGDELSLIHISEPTRH
eukprot:8408998-Karenia_brevis.AAC.1